MAAIPVETSEQLYFAIKNAKPFDVLNLAAGTFVQPALGTFRLRTSGVSIIGDPGGKTFITGGFDNLTVYMAKDVMLQHLHFRAAGRVGLYAVGSDNLRLLQCSSNGNKVSGFLTSKCHYLYVDGYEGSDNREQHGGYHSNHGMKPIIVNSRFERNGRCGFQANADRSQALPPVYFEKGQINELILKNCVMKDNGQVLAGASVNLLGCWGATVEDCVIEGGKAGGLSFSNDDDQTPAGLEYGSRNCTVRNTRISGKRGISLKNGSFGARFIDVRVNVTGGPCIDSDVHSRDYVVVSTPWVPGPTHRIWSISGKEMETAPSAVPVGEQGTTGKVPFLPVVDVPVDDSVLVGPVLP